MEYFDLINTYENAWRNVDHRVDGWLFMSSIKPVLLIVCGALIIAFYGPGYMKNRTPLKIHKTFILFSLLIIILNLFAALKHLKCALNLNYNWLCHISDSTLNEGEEMELVKTSHFYFLIKLLETYDSFFLIIRKKSNIKINILVMHHSFTAVFMWSIVRWLPSGSVFFPQMVTGLAHAVFYFYFFITASYSNLAKSPCLKLLITIFSFVQNVILTAYCFASVWSGCPAAPKIMFVGAAFLILMMIYYVIEAISKLCYNGKFHVTEYTVKLMSD